MGQLQCRVGSFVFALIEIFKTGFDTPLRHLVRLRQLQEENEPEVHRSNCCDANLNFVHAFNDALESAIR